MQKVITHSSKTVPSLMPFKMHCHKSSLSLSRKVCGLIEPKRIVPLHINSSSTSISCGDVDESLA